MEFSFQSHSIVVQKRTRQLKKGLGDIILNHTDVLLGDGRADILESLNNFVADIETIESDAKPFVVGVAGDVSSGKSSFINQILQGTVVATSVDSTTAVLTEISFLSGGSFRATIYFSSVNDIKEELRDLSVCILPLGQENDGVRFSALTSKLSNFFAFNGFPPTPPHPSTSEDLVALNGVFNLIGAIPEVIEDVNVEALLVKIAKYLKFNKLLGGVDALLPHVVKRVRIEGPFQNIPPGVVLVDTPGLNDTLRVNSQRTIDQLSSFKELWFMSDSSVALAKETDEQFLTRALVTQNRTVRIVATKADCLEADDLVKVIPSVQKNLSRILAARYFKIKTHQVPNEIPVEAMDYVNAYMSEVDINLTGIAPARYHQPPFGFDHYIGLLATAGVDAANNLTALEAALESVEDAMRTLGVVVPVHSVPVDKIEKWRLSVMNHMEDARSDLRFLFGSSRRPAIDQIVKDAMKSGSWGSMKWNTKKAVMNAARRGEFASKARVGDISINSDIAGEWVHSTRSILRKVQGIRQDSVEELRILITQWADAPPSALQLFELSTRNLTHRFRFVGDICFLGHVAVAIRAHFAANGVYHDGRRELPDRVEITELIRTALVVDSHAGFATIESVCNDTARQFAALANPVSNLPIAIRFALNSLLATPPPHPTDGEIVPDVKEVSCGITLELLEDPVATVCGHVFERAPIAHVINDPDYVGYRNCPVCRRDLTGTGLLPRHDIRAQVRRYIEHQAYLKRAAPGNVPQNDGWWVLAWREYCQVWRQAHPDEAVDADAMVVG